VPEVHEAEEKPPDTREETVEREGENVYNGYRKITLDQPMIEIR